MSEGCIVEDATIINSLIGVRSIVRCGATVTNTVLMGADYYETTSNHSMNKKQGIPDVGIGEGSIVENALVDKNARIGKHVRIRGGGEGDKDGDGWYLRDGILVVEKNGVIPDNTRLEF